MEKYTILIPLYNEIKSLHSLLNGVDLFSQIGHEIIIIDDGSTDGSKDILKKVESIKLINLTENKGKGYAIKEGLKTATNNKIIIFDGDLELCPSEIRKLMILDNINIRVVLGYRFKYLNPIKSNFEWGNFMFTCFFNLIFNSNNKDVLCCAKAFYLEDLSMYETKSIGFDIDVELSCILAILHGNKRKRQVLLNYKRRGINQGKKLKISDGWSILYRIINMTNYL